MTDLKNGLKTKIGTLRESWAIGTALGSFVLYLVGYLALRFHLTALGVGTDLAVVDERYLFAGARFAVYLVATVPSVILLALLPGLAVYFLSKITAVRNRWSKIWDWWSKPGRLAFTGIIMSVAMIQLVMRQCFLFSNLLVAPGLPEPDWLKALLLAQSGGPMALYFAGLVAGTALTGLICYHCRHRQDYTRSSVFLTRLLMLLVVIQILLLPVNYGILVVDKKVPRVTAAGGQESLGREQTAWLIWEGKEGVTFLIRDQSGGGDRRRLVSLPRREITKIEISAYDAILQVLFGSRPKALPTLPVEQGNSND